MGPPLQPTVKLYEDDAFLRRFSARVLACEPEGENWRVALDRTAFYPEGGGQPADTGTLGGAAVTHTSVQNGVIWHHTAAPLTVDSEVEGEIHWEPRLDHMEQHTGEHILSGTLHRLFGAENVGFHIGAEAVRMDTSVPLSAEQLRAAELEANRTIWQNVPVRVLCPTPEELARMTYRSKKEIAGQVRIVEIPGADVCACCGTHTAAAGEVGLIKITAAENYKGGVRLSVLCGERAVREMQAMQARQSEIMALLSAKPSETANAVRRVHGELAALKFSRFGLCAQLFDALAGAVAPGEDAIRIVPGLDPDGLHRLAVRLSEATSGLCAALTENETGCGYCLARREGDVRPLTRALNGAFSGRGGGKPGVCQGSCPASPEQVAAFLRENAGV